MSIRVNDIVIRANQTPGKASFDNFAEMKEYLEKGLEVYNNTRYTLDNIQQARNDLAVLKVVKNKLTQCRKELEEEYRMPIEVVVHQLDELIDMVKKPYNTIDTMLKVNAKEIKRRDIIGYASAHADILGPYRDKVIYSPAFFNNRWLNVTYKDAEWKRDVDSIIRCAYSDISALRALGRENTGALLAFYFNRLSLEGVEDFLKTLDESKAKAETEKITVDDQTGEVINTTDNQKIIEKSSAKPEIISRTFRLTGTSNNIEYFIKNAPLCKIRAEEL